MFESISIILSVLISVGTILFVFYRTVSAPQKQLTKINKEALATLEGRINNVEQKIMSAVEDIDKKLDILDRDTATRPEVERKLQLLKSDLKQDINKLDVKLDNGFKSLHERLDFYFRPKP